MEFKWEIALNSGAINSDRRLMLTFLCCSFALDRFLLPTHHTAVQHLNSTFIRDTRPNIFVNPPSTHHFNQHAFPDEPPPPPPPRPERHHSRAKHRADGFLPRPLQRRRLGRQRGQRRRRPNHLRHRLHQRHLLLLDRHFRTLPPPFFSLRNPPSNPSLR